MAWTGGLPQDRVAACDTHDELMRAGGEYLELFTLQVGAYADVLGVLPGRARGAV